MELLVLLREIASELRCNSEANCEVAVSGLRREKRPQRASQSNSDSGAVRCSAILRQTDVATIREWSARHRAFEKKILECGYSICSICGPTAVKISGIEARRFSAAQEEVPQSPDAIGKICRTIPIGVATDKVDGGDGRNSPGLSCRKE